MTLEEKIIKPKLGLLELAKQLGNVSAACKTMGYSRDSYYRFKELYDHGGPEALIEISRRKPILKNRVAERIEKAVVDVALEYPAYGQVRASNELRKIGILVSSGGVHSIWKRNDLNTLAKRLKALEKKVAEEGIILTEAQLKELEKQKSKKEARGEIETEHPGFLGSQDTYYVGNFKGIGKVYQQTFVDTYSRVADAKLYAEKTAITAADMLNDRVIPFFDEQEVPLLRILTDRGTEFCGSIENNAYELFLSVEGIEHSKTKAYSPQTNGICERFHKTMKNEFYDSALRRKIYNSLEELQIDVDQWLRYYNEERPHSGKICLGKTPMQTFEENKRVAVEKSNQLAYHKNIADSRYLYDGNAA
jgi:transposase InsO family protein